MRLATNAKGGTSAPPNGIRANEDSPEHHPGSADRSAADDADGEPGGIRGAPKEIRGASTEIRGVDSRAEPDTYSDVPVEPSDEVGDDGLTQYWGRRNLMEAAYIHFEMPDSLAPPCRATDQVRRLPKLRTGGIESAHAMHAMVEDKATGAMRATCAKLV